MHYHDALALLERPAVRLLNAENAAVLIAFLFQSFKQNRRATVAEGELRGLIQNHIESLTEMGIEGLRENAPSYLDEWCSPRHGYLKKYWPQGGAEPVYELTAAAEKAIEWLEELRAAGFVGTESRLERIFQDMENLLRNASGDVGERLKGLREEIARLQEEVDRIEITREVDIYTPAQINERYQLILTTCRQLLGDFRQVEDNFKDIAQQIAEKQSLPESTRGTIVGHMLDAYQVLRDTPQGQSFYGFWQLLLAADRRAKFKEAIDKVSSLEALSPELRSETLLMELTGRLLREGEKVVKSNERMAANLRRVLETTSLQERRRILDLILEIKTMALRLRAAPPRDGEFFELEELPDVFATMSRNLWEASAPLDMLTEFEEADGTLDMDEIRRLGTLPQVQMRKLRENIEACLANSDLITLDNLLEVFPPKHGLIEVLGYLVIALNDPTRNFLVFENETQLVDIPGPSPMRWRVPLAMFSRG